MLVGKRIQLYIDVDDFDMYYASIIDTEDDISYMFRFYLEYENYYVKIHQIENVDQEFITVDVASLEAIEEAIMTFHHSYRSFFHEPDPDGYCRIAETIYNPCCDLDISHDLDADSYSESDEETFAFMNSE
ncbi:hypothetical protein RF11_10914 [Thelohanellus kitauei]|uniref:Uncharacterized protein n=1 Tax=Thelohanellus kitauei TaxID=669202 RepID=A0A0C2N3A5_THEKT|nr:hypothetical protein RF11_10914 [Thelohanellus kitauei]